ncbi:transposase [Aurantivibrio plasticivorans]
MTINRESQVSLDATPFYHCYVRCVRRAYLCGEDFETGENFDHRKQWIVSRLRFLSYVYAIDICAYAVMSNHYHVVLHVDKSRADGWSQHEVVERWLQLYKGHMLVDRWMTEPAALDEASLDVVHDIIEEWRERLYSISWFMRGVNEKVARMANEEEGVKGRFWEGRFKSQALLDETAVLSCMAYVDLNPVRAGMIDDLVDSDFTSIQQRLFDYAKYKAVKSPAEKRLTKRVNDQRLLKTDLDLDDLPEAPMMPFDGSAHTDIHTALPFTREDYFDLVDKTGRVIREDKCGFIHSEIPSLINQLGINPNKWIEHIQSFSRRYAHCVGESDNIINFAASSNKAWCKGISCSRQLFEGFG